MSIYEDAKTLCIQKAKYYGRFCTKAASRFVNVLMCDIMRYCVENDVQDVRWIRKFDVTIITRLLEKIYRISFLLATKQKDQFAAASRPYLEDNMKDIYGLLHLLQQRIDEIDEEDCIEKEGK